MGKGDGKERLYKIGQAAETLGIKAFVLRFWETEFPQLEPVRTSKGQRLYTEANLALVRRIKYLLYDRGMTIDGARKALAGGSQRGGPKLRRDHRAAGAQDGPDPMQSGPELPADQQTRIISSADRFSDASQPSQPSACAAQRRQFLKQLAAELQEIKRLLVKPQ